MNRRTCTAVLMAPMLFLAIAGGLRAQVTIYTWTGGTGDPYPYVGENWSGNIAPTEEDSTTPHLVFGNTSWTYLQYYTLYAQQLEFTGNQLPYYLHGNYDSTHLGDGGIIYAPALPVQSTINDDIVLTADQTWHIASGTLAITGSFEASPHLLTKTGAGTLDLLGIYDDSVDWSGGLVLKAGRVIARARDDGYDPVVSQALGTGTLTFDGGTLVSAPTTYDSYSYQALILMNDIVSNGLVLLASRVTTYFSTYDPGTTTLTLNADTTIQATGQALYIESDIVEAGGARKLTINSDAPVIVSGASDHTGGTHVERGILIFADAASLPAANLFTTAANGYLGLGDDTIANVQTGFIDRFDKATTFGTLGFDSDPEGGTAIIDSPLDLTGFSATARLGSATSANLYSNAVITPQGADYRFGGGGGTLFVGSVLSGAHGLVLDSPAARPLTVRLDSTDNSFTGSTTITHSALLIPAGFYPGAPGSITVNTGGYLGFYSGDGEDENSALDLVNPASTGMIGFDTDSYSYDFNTAGAIDLSSYTGALYLGTSTHGYYDDGFGDGLELTGLITPAGGSSAPYLFGAYKGGLLIVGSTLTGTAGVRIGDPASPGSFGDPLMGNYSTVGLTGDNSGLSGNIILYAGQLGVSQINGVTGTDPTSALGTGSLIVEGMNLPVEWQDADGVAPRPRLVVEDYYTIIPNPITLDTDLAAGGYPDFQLAGTISGSGGLFIEDDITLTLSGNNTFSGGIYLSGYTNLVLNHDHAAGAGPLSFGGGATPEVYFNTAAPVIGGLESAESYDYAALYATQADTVLTIDQAGDSRFSGYFYSNDAGSAMRLVKEGSGTLTFEDGGLNFTNGVSNGDLGGTEIGLQVNAGTLAIGRDFNLTDGTSTIWIHGGILALDGITLTNPVAVDNGGQLQGNGGFNGAVTLGGGAVLSPGFSPGILDFDGGLTLGNGAAMEFEIQHATGAPGSGYDTVQVTGAPLNLAALSAGGFTLKLISLNLLGTAGNVADFSADSSYTWLLFDSGAGITGFNANNFTLDLSAFSNSLVGSNGIGAFGVYQVGNQIQLTFSAVPEPSTYALLALGLGASGIAAWRKRRRA